MLLELLANNNELKDITEGERAMDSSTLMGLINKIKDHSIPGQIAFMVYSLLTDAGYSYDEIRKVGTAVSALVPLLREG